MVVLGVIILLFIGAVATYLIPSHHRTSHIVVSLVPVAALGALLLPLPLPLPNSFDIPWIPAELFPESLVFRASASSTSFAVFFCCLLILIEWTRPMRQSPGRSSRAVIFLFTASAISACFASSPLAVIILWSWIDFFSFLAIVFLKSPVEIGSGGISSSLTHSLGILSMNMVGSIFVLFSIFLVVPGASPDWAMTWGDSAISISPILFMAGIAFRLLIVPLQFTFSRIQTASTGVEILLRIAPPAVVLCFLSNVWPAQSILGQGGYAWMTLPFALAVLIGGWQWCISRSPFGRRDIFILVLPSFAVLSALVQSPAERIFLSAGAVFILGGGILLVYIGYLENRRWMAGFLVFLGIIFSGIPFSPMALWSGSVYPALLSDANVSIFLLLIFSQIFILCALFRIAFESVEEFPSNEPLFLFAFSAGMVICLGFLFYPGWTGILSTFSIAFPVLILLGSVLILFLFRRLHRNRTAIFPFLENFFRLEWLQKGLLFSFRKSSLLISGVESFLSGEGALLWSLGIALLLYLVFRGG